MGRDQHVGGLEELALLAVLRLGEDAYGASVRRELRKRAGRSVTVSTVYVTLMRLEEKGLVSSGLAEPTAVRGGKAKRYFRVTDAGLASLQEGRAVMERMWDGLDDALRPADAHGG